MATRKLSYNTVTAPTFTLASLATSSSLLAGQQSAAIDNTTTLYLDFQVRVKVRLGTTPTVDKTVELWVIPSIDGTNWPGGAGATDAAYSPATRDVLFGAARLADSRKVDATTGRDVELSVDSVAQCFGGCPPRKFALFVVHDTVAALDADAGDHTVVVEGIAETIA